MSFSSLTLYLLPSPTIHALHTPIASLWFILQIPPLCVSTADPFLLLPAACPCLAAWPGLREKDKAGISPWLARQDEGCPLREQGEAPSMCVLLALHGAAWSLILSCSTVVTLMSECLVSAWKLGEFCSLKCSLLTSPYLLGHDLVTYSGLDPLSCSPDFPLALDTLS